MEKNGNILVAFDGSESSINALRQTIRYSKINRKAVLVLTVQPPYEGELEYGLVKNIKAVFRKHGEKILSSAEAIAKEEGGRIEAILQEGQIYDVIADTARKRNCGLIVLGRRGLNKIDRVLMGSITARVIGFSPVNVLVVPNNAQVRWSRILLAVDGSQCSEVAAIKAIKMARDYNGELKVLSVVDVPPEVYPEAQDVIEAMIGEAREIVRNIEDLARLHSIRVESFIREGNAFEKIIELSNELKVDLICMGSHGRTGLRRLLVGSVTEKVIGGAARPILVVKD
ncbi:MAG: universal stress protein [Firmicutes bacterium]|nr:universal stress protein [Bacillota bacterium]